MKILHLLSSRKWTGAAEPVFLLCRGLMQRGHEVHLAYSQPLKGKRLSSRHLREGKLGLFIEPSRSLYRPGMKQKADEWGLTVLADLKLNVIVNIRDNWNDYKLLRSLFKQGRYDIIHCHLGHAFYLALFCRGSQSSNPQLIYTHHSTKPLRRNFLHRTLIPKRTAHIIAHCPEVEQAYQKDFGIPPERISLLKGGIDLQPFESPPSGKEFRSKLGIPQECLLVGMVARMQERRDHFTLIRALAEMNLPQEKLSCLLIGDGEHRIPIENLIQESGLKEQVWAPGYLGEDYLEALSAVDVFVYTAPGSDASCRAVIEAMAMGKPVIGVHRASVPLLIEEEKSGFLFEPGSVSELSEKIQFFLKHPEKIIEFGQRGRERVEAELSSSHLVDEVEKIYQKVLGYG